VIRTKIAVIGSGPGGAITACLLAEAGLDVTILEEGPNLPLDSAEPFSLDETVQKYRNGGLTVAIGGRVQYVEGRCVGGGSEVSYGFYQRTPPDILARWRTEHRVVDARDEDLDEHFGANERELSVGFYPGTAAPAAIKLRDGAEHMGWRCMEVPRWYRYYANEADPKEPIGIRQSMSQTFVPRAMEAGARLVAGARARHLSRNGARWQIDLAASNGQPESVEAEHVFVCAGAIGTPALLLRSGITRNIGKTLRMHPAIKAVARFDDVVNDESPTVPMHQVKEFLPALSFGCAVSTLPHLALAVADSKRGLGVVNESWRQMTSFYAMVGGESLGSVSTVPGSDDPLVTYNLTPGDRALLRDGLEKLVRLLFAAGAREVIPGMLGAPSLRNVGDIAALPDELSPDRTNLSSVHLFSTCPMGENRDRCAVDSFGRVPGFHGLRISDASILPTATGAYPQGSVMAFARRNALQFLETHA
jgi:choline dehydrogenase-like flavoprotein